MVLRLSFSLKYKMNNSQGKTTSNFNSFPQCWQPTHHSNSDKYSWGWGAYSKRWKSLTVLFSDDHATATRPPQGRINTYLTGSPRVSKWEIAWSLWISLRLSCRLKKNWEYLQQKWTWKEIGLQRYSLRTASQFCTEVFDNPNKPNDYLEKANIRQS